MKAEFKVPGGKLIQAEVQVTEDKLSLVKLSGDFFMHPEEAITDLEAALTGVKVDDFGAALDRFFSEKDLTFYGVSPEDFRHVIELALAA